MRSKIVLAGIVGTLIVVFPGYADAAFSGFITRNVCGVYGRAANSLAPDGVNWSVGAQSPFNRCTISQTSLDETTPQTLVYSIPIENNSMFTMVYPRVIATGGQILNSNLCMQLSTYLPNGDPIFNGVTVCTTPDQFGNPTKQLLSYGLLGASVVQNGAVTIRIDAFAGAHVHLVSVSYNSSSLGN